MAYAFPEHVRLAFPKVHTSGFTNEDIERFIARADAFIDAYLARRYPVPFQAYPNTPPLLHQLSIDMVIPYIYDRSPTTPQWVNNLYERALDTLKSLGDGTLAVVGPDGGIVDERSDIGVVRSSTEGYTPTYLTYPAPLDEHVDPSRVADEDGQRE